MEINNETTLIILDWDDTLFPTTWIHKHKIDIFNNTALLYEKFFKNLDILLHKLFKLLIQCGTVIIITNALLNWIDISITLLPNLNNLIKSSNIRITSARGEYSHINKDPEMWKKMAFRTELKNITMNMNMNMNMNINNIISIGDADYEYYALINLCDNYNNINEFKLLKSIKFIRYPDIIKIYKQIDLLCECIIKVSKETLPLDLEIRCNE